ncbi:MAG: hypothetical protein VKP62_06790 [Candidatus Sericytochromatia bacterium]|nr:hypothetical protein [Candidatus Sericytochromatia bacterium]
MAFILLIAVLNTVIGWRYVRAVQQRAPHTLWLMPPTYVLGLGYLVYTLYPLWISSPWSPDPDLDPDTLALSMLFATVFQLILLAVFFLRGFPDATPTSPSTDDPQEAERYAPVLHLGFLFALAPFAYRAATGNWFTLYEDITDLHASLGGLICESLYPVVYMYFPLAFSLLKHARLRGVIAFQLGLLGLVLLTSAAISTAKGQLLLFLFLYLVYVNLTQQRLRKGLIAGLLVLGVAFSIYSHTLRLYGKVRGEVSWEVLSRNAGVISETFLENSGTALNSLVERHNQIRGLYILMTRPDDWDREAFFLGSVVELGNLIPRWVWPDRPHLSFNHFATRAIWGHEQLLSETPVGRIGEAYFVFGPFGLVFAAIYGLFFRLLWQFRLAYMGEPFWQAAYGMLLFMFVIPDAYMFYNIKAVLLAGPGLFALWLLHRRQQRERA